MIKLEQVNTLMHVDFNLHTLSNFLYFIIFKLYVLVFGECLCDLTYN